MILGCLVDPALIEAIFYHMEMILPGKWNFYT
jgi:hypothetical protein